MCRNIQPLYNYSPPTTEEDVHAAALQYVRKVSGMNAPSRVNHDVFVRAVEEVAAATERLLAELVTSAPPRSRELEAARRRARSAERFGRV
jgi:hypothetical protein